MAFSLLKILEPFWLFNFHLFQPQASPNPLPQSRRTPTQPQPLSQGLFSPKPALSLVALVATPESQVPSPVRPQSREQN